MNIPTGIGNVPQPLNVQGPAATNAAGQADNLKQSNASGVSVASSTQSDAVSVSAGLLTQDAAGADVRVGRVQELQQAIAAGTYSVPASAVADKLIESMQG